jgi:UDP-N-acetylglucosamine 2-epimerase (non-hydrolysing)
MTIALITGTRPEIIKMYPIMKLFDSKSIKYKYIHTGQHYNYDLFLKFIDEFGIRRPDILITMDASEPVSQVSKIMEEIGTIVNKICPSLVLLEGDTNSVLGSALAALKSRIPIAHVESGLRSNDWKTVEEHNRRIVDHISDILFSPTGVSTKNLQNENVYGEIHTVGNTVIDAINLCLEKGSIIDESDSHNGKDVFSSLGVDQPSGDFILVTMHRSENVDDANSLKQLLMALSESKLNYIFPIHPRTFKRIKEYGLTKYIGKGIKVLQPLGYLGFLRLLSKCSFVVTDSGGVQEEVTFPKINKRAIVLRDCTERPESVKSGHSVLCKLEHKAILEGIQKFWTNRSDSMTMTTSPYGDGNAAIKITEILERKFA